MGPDTMPPGSPAPGGSGFIEKLASAALDRVTGALTDEEKAEVLTDLVDELHNLNVTLDFWSVVLTEWSRSGGRSVAALQTCVRDALNSFGDPWAEAPEDSEGGEPAEDNEDGEGPPDNEGRVIEPEFRQAK